MLITDEYNTSKKCPLSFQDVKDITEQDESLGDRLRKCATIHEDTATLTVEESESSSQLRDRDCIGSVNINQKGIYIIFSNAISNFERD